ncbi:hypothetical protein DFH11DRAFT_1562142 [Phellopilus nigrolimitatus]|nr:hypothetical protein DFH11DRAFT_1562142 [Phellopilus nigrolimitatus]
MNESDGENEVSQRKGADSLIQLAFQMRSGAKHKVSFEVDVAMPVNPEMRIQVPYASADAVATLPFPRDLNQKLVNDLREHFRLHWSVIANNGSYVNLPISILSFLVEEKRFKAPPNQLAMYFTAALYHRRALGLPDIPVFGASVDGGVFELFISGWDKGVNGTDIVKTRTSGYTWNLEDPPQLVQCFFFLCRLSDHIHDEMQSMFAGLDKHKLIRTIKEEAKNNAWRILDPKGKYDESEDEISASSSDDESGGYK